eukprot:4910464-Pyramimonas_sp.AAC.1
MWLARPLEHQLLLHKTAAAAGTIGSKCQTDESFGKGLRKSGQVAEEKKLPINEPFAPEETTTSISEFVDIITPARMVTAEQFKDKNGITPEEAGIEASEVQGKFRIHKGYFVEESGVHAETLIQLRSRPRENTPRGRPVAPRPLAFWP